jgi:hypothetical protein
VNEPNPLQVAIAFDTSVSDSVIGEQELALIGDFLPELLKTMIWQTSEQEN